LTKDSVLSLSKEKYWRGEIVMDGLLARFNVDRWNDRNFAVYDGEDLVCVTVYRKGAEEVRRRMIAYELLLMEANGILKAKQSEDL
jgi:hypothetical protein